MLVNQGKDATLEPAYFADIVAQISSGGGGASDKDIQDLKNKVSQLEQSDKTQNSSISNITINVQKIEQQLADFEPISSDFISALTFTDTGD